MLSYLSILLSLVSGIKIIDEFLGIKLDSHKLRMVEAREGSGYGFFHAEEAKAGAALLSVPFNYSFTTLSHFPLYPYISDLETHTIAAVRLVYERYSDPGSFFSEFAKTFHEDYNILPLWPPSQKALLYDYAIEVFTFQSFADHWEQEYEMVKSRLHNVPEAPQEIYNFIVWKWAYNGAVAKTFEVMGNKWKGLTGEKIEKYDHVHEVRMFIPILDLINHNYLSAKDRENPAKYLAFQDGMFHYVAQRDFKKGEEAAIEYEPDGNFHLLLRWGFAIEKYYLEEFFLNITGGECTERKLGNTCLWGIKTFEVNERLLSYLRNNTENESVALNKYRELMKKHLERGKQPLRHARRIKKHYDWRNAMAINYGICQRLLLIEQMKFSERRMLMFYMDNLKLNTVA